MSSRLRYFVYTGAAALCGMPSAVMAADGDTGSTITLPAEFNTAIGQLEKVGQDAASALAPMVMKVGGAFVVLGLIIVAFRYFRRGAK